MTSSTELPHKDPHALYSLDVSLVPGTDAQVRVPPCVVCTSAAGRAKFCIAHTKFFIVECLHCGLGRLLPAPSTDELQSFYPEDYYGNEGSKFSALIEPLVQIVGTRRAWFIARQIGQHGRVLDVGCGRGITLRALADRGFETHGFEVSAQAIQGIDRRVRTRVAGSLEQAQYPDQYFDGLIIWHVLEHVPEPAATLSEAYRILKPGSKLIVAVPNFSSLQARWSGPAWFHLDPPRHLFHFPMRSLEKLLNDSGFDCRSVHHFSLRQNTFGWIQSALNKLPWVPRNSLYAMLHCEGGKSHRRLSQRMRMQLWAWFWILALPALVLSILAAFFRSGATVHVVATRRDTQNPRNESQPLEPVRL